MNFIRKIFSFGFFFSSLVLFAYIIYKSKIFVNFELSNEYRYYFLISITLIVISIINFYLNKKQKNYFIIILTTIIFTIYAFEGYILFKLTPNYKNEIDEKAKIYKNIENKTYDKRSKLEIFNDLKENFPDISIASGAFNHLESNNDFLPFAGRSNVQTIYCNENGYYSIYKSDRYGFNNPDPEWEAKEIEYLLVGDSFVHGACVNRPNDIGSVLRRLSKKSVLNLGYGGSGPLTQYATLREYLENNVKNVVWFYYEGNDIRDLNNQLKNEILKKYLTNINFTQNIKSKQNKIDKLKINLVQKNSVIKKNSMEEFVKFIKLGNLRFFFFHIRLQPQFKDIIKLTKKLTDEKNSRLYFVYLPEFIRYKNSYSNSNYFKIKAIMKEFNIPFISVHEEIFKKTNNPLQFFPFERNGHYNSKGYKKVAEIIIRSVENF